MESIIFTGGEIQLLIYVYSDKCKHRTEKKQILQIACNAKPIIQFELECLNT